MKTYKTMMENKKAQYDYWDIRTLTHELIDALELNDWNRVVTDGNDLEITIKTNNHGTLIFTRKYNENDYSLEVLSINGKI